MRHARALVHAGIVLALASAAEAQPLGTFRWQLQPYCNLIAVAVVQEGGSYRLEGTDDQCGGGRDLASATGLAFANPDGTIGFGLTVVTTPGGAPVHIDAEVTLPGLSGSWRDSTGATGTFVFSPSGASGGSPRPTVPPVLPATVVLLENGTAPSTSGSRLLWHGERRAFRAGQAENGDWSETNLGFFSAAFGRSTRASGEFAFSTGVSTYASGIASVALGYATQALGQASTAFGHFSGAVGDYSTAMGANTLAVGATSTAMGAGSRATGSGSTATGVRTVASGANSLAAGFESTASGMNALAGGNNATAGGLNAFAFGSSAAALGANSMAIGSGVRTTATATGSILLGDGSSSYVFESNLPDEFGVRAAGGIYFYTRPDLGTGVALAPDGSSWAALSDVNAKENFRDVDGEDLLRKLAQIPVREWNYKAQDAAIRHMGPTAQDFRAAFGLGDFPLRINTIDADGVALAGVKALEARTRALPETAATLVRLEALCAATHDQLDAANADLAAAMAELRSLRDRLAALEQLLNRR